MIDTDTIRQEITYFEILLLNFNDLNIGLAITTIPITDENVIAVLTS